MTVMYVTKRDGRHEKIDNDKVYTRIKWLVNHPYPLNDINIYELTAVITKGLTNYMKTSEIDDHTATLAASLGVRNYDYLILAGRICINNHHKNTLDSFSDKITKLYLRKSSTGKPAPAVNYKFNKYVNINKDQINKYIDYSRDYAFTYFGFRTLEKGYLLTVNEEIVERPQDLIMRVAIALWMPEEISEFKNPIYLKKIFKVYDRMSMFFYTHATPTLFNAGAPIANYSSCFLLSVEDSKEGILKAFTNCCIISAESGGVGADFGDIRGEGSMISRSDLPSKGTIPFLRVFQGGARAFDQGGKRNGSFAIYKPMHHPDIKRFLALVLKDGADENLRCLDLFTALWIPDLFMERMIENGKWHLFCPNEFPRLNETFGDEYKELYLKYERETDWSKRPQHEFNARDLWMAIKLSHEHSGLPYMLYKDNVNRCNMMNNINIINCSNLCVTGDTMITTNKGNFPIKELTESGDIHSIWNGEKFTPAVFKKTGTDQEILEIKTTHDYNVKCTPHHKFILVDKDATNGKKEKIIDAKDLVVGDELIEYTVPDSMCTYTVRGNCIKSITKLETREDTYCFNEPLKNRGVFNGLLLGQCVEILLPSTPDQYSVCNLASICLAKFVFDTYSPEELELDESERRALNHEFPIYPKYDYKLLAEVAGELVENLNQVIDRTHNPVIEAARGNFRNRPVGIGIQGLADVFLKFQIPFESDQARDINKRISEAIYYGALNASTTICRNKWLEIKKNFDPEVGYTKTIYTKDVLEEYPKLLEENVLEHYSCKEDLPRNVFAYPTYMMNGGGPISKGQFHWELFGLEEKDLSGLFDWQSLRDKILQFGVRNSVLVAYMPTGTTSHIMGNSPCIEPYTANAYTKKTIAGKHIVINKFLAKYLQDNGLYNEQMINYLIKYDGSIQGVEGIPDNIKALYKTVWEIKQKAIVQMAIDRQPFIDQSQSMNLWFEDYTDDKFTSAQVYGWKNGLKTGSYYIRTRAAVMPEKFTLSVDDAEKLKSLDETLKSQKEKMAQIKEVEEQLCIGCSA